MKNLKNKRTTIMLIILLGLLVLAYKVMFAPASEDLSNGENVIVIQRIETMLNEVKSINFDTSIIENQNFKSLKSIEIPLLSLPVGRKNPFSPTSASN
jgi:hypothetical protein